MKKIFSIIFTGTIDLLTILLLSLLFWIIAQNASGLLFSDRIFLSEGSLIANLNILKYFLLFITIPYVCISIICKRSLGSFLCNNIRRRHFWKILAASLLDFWIVIIFTIILNFLLQNIFFFETFNLLFLLVLFYWLISATFAGKTIGRYVFGIKLVNKNNNKFFFKYEIIKFTVIIAIPYLLLCLLGIVDLYAIFLNIIFIGFISTIFSIIIIKKTIWTKFSSVTKRYVSYSKIRHFINFMLLLILFFGSFILIKALNNNSQPEITKILGFNYPYKYTDYPNEKSLKAYTDFLKTQSTSPKEYILNLFDKYDVVILQESYHGESTQWNLITEIVHDSIFIHNVGHIFTEYGSAMHQNKIDFFLNTKFENDTILEQETAILMDYMSSGFYYFIKNLNLLNNQLPDPLKIVEHYCDVIDWDYFSTFSRSEMSKTDINRDSLMAQITIDWYKKQISENKRHKCLVVTNTRHAFGYAGGIEKIKNYQCFKTENQGQYIWEQIPENTANVMFVKYIPLRALFFPSYQPIHFGKWDKSFELNGNIPLGFDLKDSPFGNDYFDARFSRGGRYKLNYSDIYTGLVFHKPFMDLRSNYHPYRKFAIEQEAIRKGITDSLQIRNKTRFYSNEAYSYDDIQWFREAGYVNFIPILFFVILGVMNIFCNLIYLILKCFRNNRTLY